MSRVGLGLGSLLVLLAATMSAFGLKLLSKSAILLNNRNTSFYEISKVTYANAAVVLDAAVAIKCFGVSISYLVVIGDLMPEITKTVFPSAVDSLYSDKNFWITIGILLISPISFFKKLDSLKYTSTLALVAVFYLVSIVVGFALIWPEGMPKSGWMKFENIVWFRFGNGMEVAKLGPVFVFAFTCHQNIFAVHNELYKNTKKRMAHVINLSISSAFVIYQTIGILGYLSYGESLNSNIITMYPKNSFVTFGQFAITILVLLSFPLQCHPCRQSLDKVLDGIAILYSGDAESGDNTIKKGEISPLKFNLMTLSILVFAYIVAISVKDLSSVSATGSTTICYILPGILFNKMCWIIEKEPIQVQSESAALLQDDQSQNQQHSQEVVSCNANEFHQNFGFKIGNVGNKVERYFGLLLSLFGFFFMILSVSVQLFAGQSVGH
ncbi:hypothetical protein HDU92_004660 [Lobulomyces angularis]|nr:hypothetical protein HDU92_004660 [Lobulomyces angularis]